MAILVINNEDFTEKLKDFALKCKNCDGGEVELEIDWAAYPSASWCKVTVICKACHNDEEVYST